MFQTFVPFFINLTVSGSIFFEKLRDTCEEVDGVWKNNELQIGIILLPITEFITASKSPF